LSELTGAMASNERELQALAVDAAHRRAVDLGAASYLDPATGYIVFTADTLLARGECCGSGCRHCPWPEEEQRRAGRPSRSD